MSKAEIIAELSNLSPDDLADVLAKLDELAGTTWQDHGELSDADKSSLNAAISEYEKSPDAASTWDEVKARIRAKLQPPHQAF
jgi:putative addiction module component (TIGR02574 family)